MLNLIGKLIELGDLEQEGKPGLVISTQDGRDIVITGLTRQECQAITARMFGTVRITVTAEN